MMYRCYDAIEVLKSVAPYATDYEDAWLEDENNIALSDGKGNINLFTFERPGVYSGHYYYLNARGIDAYVLAEESLRKMFEFYDAKLIFGLVPVDRLGAINLSLKLGFEDHGDVSGYGMRMKLFILTKKDYENGRNN